MYDEKWLNDRMSKRMSIKLKCRDLYSSSNTSSPNVYAKYLDKYRKQQELKIDTEHEDLFKKATADKENIDHGNEPINHNQESDSDDEYGPKPLQIAKSLNKKVHYGKELLPGEGDAIAQYVQEGKRIPRRGEVGLTSEQIENFERIGYVMSGSRHKAMDAMRIKKEALVYNAENERARTIQNYENHINNENAIINNLKNILRKQQSE